MSTYTRNDNYSREDVAAFIYPTKTRTLPTRRKLATFVNNSMDKCSSKFDAAIKRVAGLLPVKKSKAKAKSKGSLSAQGEVPVRVSVEVANSAEPVQFPSEVVPLNSIHNDFKVDQDEGASGEPDGTFKRLVNAFHSDDDFDADEPGLDELESASAQEHRWTAPRVPIAFASGRYAAFPWPSPVAVSCFSHQRIGLDSSTEPDEHAPTSSVADSYNARLVAAQDSSPSEAVKALILDPQEYFFSRRPPSGEQSRQEIQDYTAASIKRPALKPLRMKTRVRKPSLRPVSGLIQPSPERWPEVVNFVVPQLMSAVFVDAYKDTITSPTWFSGDEESLSEDDELAEITGCSLAFWDNILGQTLTDSHDQSGLLLDGSKLQSSPEHVVDVVHLTVPEPMSATVIGGQVSLDSDLSQLDVERRAAYIAEHSRDIITGPSGKRSSMIEWLKLIQSEGDNTSSPPSSPESSLPATPSSMLSPLPDFGDALEHGFKTDYAVYDLAISRGFDAGDNLLSLYTPFRF